MTGSTTIDGGPANDLPPAMVAACKRSLFKDRAEKMAEGGRAHRIETGLVKGRLRSTCMQRTYSTDSVRNYRPGNTDLFNRPEFQDVFSALDQLLAFEWLDDVILDTHFYDLHHVFLAGFRREHYHRNIL